MVQKYINILVIFLKKMGCCDATNDITDDDSTFPCKSSSLKAHVEENRLTPQLWKCKWRTDVKNCAQTASSACRLTLMIIRSKSSM